MGALDPSHLFWMGAAPHLAAHALGDAVFHVHAKDTMLNAPVQATASLLENASLMNIPARSWSGGSSAIASGWLATMDGCRSSART